MTKQSPEKEIEHRGRIILSFWVTNLLFFRWCTVRDTLRFRRSRFANRGYAFSKSLATREEVS